MSSAVQIASMGQYLPRKVVSSASLEERLNLEAGWIEDHQGVAERRWAEGEETHSFMGAQAALEALKEAALIYDSIRTTSDELLVMVPTVLPALAAVERMPAAGERLDAALTTLVDRYRQAPGRLRRPRRCRKNDSHSQEQE